MDGRGGVQYTSTGLVISLVDGAAGDDDQAANGVIATVGGPGGMPAAGSAPDERVVLTEVIPATVAGNVAAAGGAVTFSNQSAFLGTLTEDVNTFDFEQSSGFPAASAIIGTVDDVDFQGRIGFAVSPPPPSGTQFMRGTGASSPYDEVGIVSFWDLPNLPNAVGFVTGFSGIAIPAPYTRVQIFNQFEDMIHEEFIATAGGAGTYFGFVDTSEAIGFIELQGMEADLLTEADAQQFGIDNLTIGSAGSVGDNVNNLPGAVPKFVSAAVDAAGGSGSNGTVRIHMEWNIADLAGAVVQNAEVLLRTNQGAIDELDTFFFVASVDGNGTLEESDFQTFALQIDGVAMEVTGTPGTAGTFAFDVTSQLQRSINAGFDYFVLQGRVDESLNPGSIERGLQVHSTSTSSPVGEHPQLTVNYEEEAPPGEQDGVSDAVESGAPNQGDGNNDGVPDSQQNNVSSLPNAGTGEYVTIVAPGGTQLSSVSASLIGGPAVGTELPIGVVSYTLSGLSVGASAIVTLIPQNSLAAGSSYYKFGAEAGNTTPHWYEFDFQLGTGTGAKFYNAAGGLAGPSDPVVRIDLHLVDGARGDDDLTANGTVVDPGGPTVLNVAPILTVANATSTTGIGSTASNSGTFSDALGQVVMINSSVGNVGYEEGSSGNWTWRFGPGIGSSQNQTVTITATDNFGAQSTAQFNLIVSDTVPDVLTIVPDALTVAEGTTVTVTGTYDTGAGTAPFTGTAVWSDGVSTPLTLDVPPATGAGTYHTSRVLDDTGTDADGANGFVTVTVTIIDANLGSDSITSAPITVTNVIPTITAVGTPDPVNEGALFTLTLGNVLDTPNDIVTAYSVSWGDGNVDDFTVASDGAPDGKLLTHVYADGPGGPFEIIVSLTDEDGTHTSGADTLSAVDNVVPAVDVTGSSTSFVGISYALTIGELIDPGDDTVSSFDIDWGDGTPVETFNRAPVSDEVLTHTYVAAQATAVIGVSVTDEDGTFANLDTLSITVTDNFPPFADNDVATTNEDTAVVIDVLANDFDPDGDPLTIDSVTQPVLGGQVTSSGNDVTFDPQGEFESLAVGESAIVTFSYTISDGNDGFAMATVTVTVTGVNDDPEITDLTNTSNGATKVGEGDRVDVSGSFSDVDTSDTHTATVDWGDGSAPQMLDVTDTGQTGSFTSATGSGHSYDDGGAYTVTVMLNDGHGGLVTKTTEVFVTGSRISDRVLYIVGTNSSDLVTINKQGNGLFKIHADFFPEANFRTFPTSEVDLIVVFFCGGDDQLNIAGNISTPILANGGSGDDFLKGGAGPDVLIGGTGADDLHGKKGDDALIGDGTLQDADHAALVQALQAWTANASYAARVAGIDGVLTVVDDEHTDELKGDQGRDLFYNGLGDDLQDVANDETTLPVVPASEGGSADIVELALSFAQDIAESAGSLAVTLSRNAGDLSRSLTVTLASGDPSELTVPASITIPAGSASISFNAIAVNDGLIDGAQVAAIIAKAQGAITGVSRARINEANFPYRNAANENDVNEDGFVTPLDALVLINAILDGGSRELSNGELIVKLDVSGDNSLSSIDVLRVINFMNNESAAMTEGPAALASVATPSNLSEPRRYEDADGSSDFVVGIAVTTERTETTVRSQVGADSSDADERTPEGQEDQPRVVSPTPAAPGTGTSRATDADDLEAELEQVAEDLIGARQLTAHELLFGRLA